MSWRRDITLIPSFGSCMMEGHKGRGKKVPIGLLEKVSNIISIPSTDVW